MTSAIIVTPLPTVGAVLCSFSWLRGYFPRQLVLNGPFGDRSGHEKQNSHKGEVESESGVKIGPLRRVGAE